MNKITERIASLILALAMILGNTIHTQAAGSTTNPGTSSAPVKTFANASSILTVNVGNTQNLNTGANHQQLNITKNDISPTTQRTNAAQQLASPPLQSAGIGMWISQSELMSLPTSGAAWDKMRTAAYGSWGTADLKNKDNKHDINLLAGALVYARTGDASLRSKVRDGILAAKRTLDESAEWQTRDGVLSAGRQIGAYAISADLIDLKSFDASADNEFRSWLTTIRTTNIGTHGRWKAITYTCENAAGNWNTFACASRIAASIYLGDTADVDRAASIIRAFFGERSAYPANAPGRNGYFEHTAGYQSSWACNDATWTGINPACDKSGVNIDGVLVEDASRGGGCCVLQGSGISYSWEALQGLFVSAELLYRTGRYGDPYSWSNQALKRAMDFMQRSGWGIANVAKYIPWLANARYGTSYPQAASFTGRIMSWGDWLYQR
jgi:Alginate lyase